jgi:hypothetical protein
VVGTTLACSAGYVQTVLEPRLPYLVSLDLHIEELEERINTLRDRMATMVAESYETKAHEVLLSNMLRLWEDMKSFRAGTLEIFNTSYSESRDCEVRRQRK